MKKWYQNLLSKFFWRRNWKTIAAIAGGVAIIILFSLLLIDGQQDVGAQEAGTEITKLAQNIRNRYKTRPDFWGLSTAEVVLKKIYPQSMSVEDTQLKGYFGNIVEVGSDENGSAVMPTVRNFVIAYKNLTKSQCMALGANKFEQSFWLGVTGMKIDNGSQEQIFNWSTKDFMLPADKNKIKALCKNNNTIIFYFE